MPRPNPNTTPGISSSQTIPSGQYPSLPPGSAAKWAQQVNPSQPAAIPHAPPVGGLAHPTIPPPLPGAANAAQANPGGGALKGVQGLLGKLAASLTKTGGAAVFRSDFRGCRWCYRFRPRW